MGFSVICICILTSIFLFFGTHLIVKMLKIVWSKLKFWEEVFVVGGLVLAWALMLSMWYIISM